ncbi:hypothetical protein B0H17DRAFT_1136146 [Mycena rosella]|uniref:CxC5 like cysteine cluster associated with KDZ domain-containing protein n=1 Tax=Mycena rosella TaxID=1033263 RepID=A0AAD7DB96_MYCRO|nr:hypothetical protein B0H17DRAFT_1136146 [Mycena rosella]
MASVGPPPIKYHEPTVMALARSVTGGLGGAKRVNDLYGDVAWIWQASKTPQRTGVVDMGNPDLSAGESCQMVEFRGGIELQTVFPFPFEFTILQGLKFHGESCLPCNLLNYLDTGFGGTYEHLQLCGRFTYEIEETDNFNLINYKCIHDREPVRERRVVSPCLTPPPIPLSNESARHLWHPASLSATQGSQLALNFHGLNQFLRMACLARQTITFQQVNNRRPPPVFPPAILQTISSSLNVSETSLVQTCWAAFKDILWDHPMITPSDEKIITYNNAALGNGTAYRYIYLPVRVCSNPECTNHRNINNIMTLTDPLTHKATLYTLQSGVLPVYMSSLYCRSCNRRYYHNYYVHKKSSLRTYYGGVPNVIQVALSAPNWARIYNCALSEIDPHIANNKLAFASVYGNHKKTPPEGWNLELRNVDVTNGFFLYSLLLEKSERGGILLLLHDEPSQKDRLKPALAECNKAMEGIGQEHWAHACDLCFVIFEDTDGNIKRPLRWGHHWAPMLQGS